MPINFTDFSNIRPQDNGVGDLFSQILKGYKMSREPARMGRQEEQENLANKLRQHQVTHAGQVNEFYPQQQEVQLQQKRQQIQELANKLNVQPEMLELALGQSRRSAERDINFGDELERAKINKLVNVSKETPEEKRQKAMELFYEKERFKNENKKNQDLTEITPATRTKYQSIIREVNSVMPVMKELVNLSGERNTILGTASDLKYLGKIKRIADVYMKAKGWPNTDKARSDAIQLFKRGLIESKKQYKDRMQELEKELEYERDLSADALKGGKSEIASDHHIQNNIQMVQIRNKRTGETKMVSKEEAMQLGASQ